MADLRASGGTYYLRPVRGEAAALHTHASNVLYLKRRRHRLASPVPVPGEDGTPQSGNPWLFLLVVLIGAGAAAMLIANIVIASRYPS